MSTQTQSIRDIVTQHPFSAQVFQRFDIDLCLQADLSLANACQELQLSVDQVLETLADAERKENGAVARNPEDFSMSRLIQHIVRVHHHCVRQELPRLAARASKVATLRSARAPKLQLVTKLVERLRGEMYEHIQKEEEVLFPCIAQMDQDSVVAYPPAHPCFRSIAYPVFMMEQEHESADHLVAELAQLTNQFDPPSWACVTHIALFSGLREFVADLKQHVHLEDDILFPRAIQLETELKGRG
ncbi:MAG: DUF542 domain-containing protein [Acidobacteriota bacterium]